MRRATRREIKIFFQLLSIHIFALEMLSLYTELESFAGTSMQLREAGRAAGGRWRPGRQASGAAVRGGRGFFVAAKETNELFGFENEYFRNFCVRANLCRIQVQTIFVNLCFRKNIF